jgi:hypothetical protein
MPPVRPASLPFSVTAPGPQPIAVATAVEAVPEKTVRCGYCNAVNYVSQMHDVPARPRCADVAACTRRWADGAKPVSLVPHAAGELEPLPGPDAPVLPPAQEEALGRFEAAHAEQDAVEAGEDLSEDDEPATPAGAQAPDSSDEAAPVAAEPEPEDGGEGE